ncbi:MAG: DUF2063 domain-containing protein [Gallionella sp.]|jgi:hypothetical protein|nr:DUF2063 domain-containing protein [Gallionella sp.]
MLALHDDLSDFAFAIVQGKESSPQIVTAYRNYPAAVAMEIYRNNYRGNLHDALAGAYPVIKQLVGDDFFRFLTREFIAQYPSRNANLHHYGVELAGFLTAFAPAQTLVYLADVALLEWACHVAYFADDEVPLNIHKLAQIPPERYTDLILRIHPACRVVRSHYPVAAIWQAHQPAAGCDFHIDLNSRACIALVSRKDDVVQVAELAEADADWLHAIQSGVSMGAATDSTLARHPGFDLPAALQMLVAQHILTNFNLGATT